MAAGHFVLSRRTDLELKRDECLHSGTVERTNLLGEYLTEETRSVSKVRPIIFRILCTNGLVAQQVRAHA